MYYVNNSIYDNKFRYLFTSVARSFLFEYSDDQIYQVLSNKTYKLDNIVCLCKEIDLYMPLNDIINMIIDKFQIYEKLTKLSDIDKSLVRISNLQDIANSLSSLGYDVLNFVKYLDDVIDNGLTVKYSVNTSGGDSVKIMNIHKSKGLEFSLCYFTGMHNKFTIKEINDKILFSLKYGMILPYMDEELKETIVRDLYVDNYFLEEVSEKIRLFYVALTRCREKMIIVTSLNDNNNSYSRLVPYEDRIKYRSFLDIISSINVIDKYIVNKSCEYTKEYDNNRIKDIEKTLDGNIIEKRKLDIDCNVITKRHFSKEIKNIFNKDEIKAIEYGNKIHEMLEFASFDKGNNEYIDRLLDKIDNNFINVYKEYEFIYEEDGIEYNGVIDLMLEYDDYINIIDYKLKNIDDKAYIKQLKGYKKYIEMITLKKVDIYLYSVLDNDLMKIT